MSRGLERSAAELERKAQDQAAVIRRVVREYNESVRSDPSGDLFLQLKKQREIERSIAQFAALHKALKRLRKRMRAKE
jgi:Mg2+ and Co2+ transporter CorA